MFPKSLYEALRKSTGELMASFIWLIVLAIVSLGAILLLDNKSDAEQPFVWIFAGSAWGAWVVHRTMVLIFDEASKEDQRTRRSIYSMIGQVTAGLMIIIGLVLLAIKIIRVM